MKIGLIADDFTRLCFEMEPELSVVNLTPKNFFYKIVSKRPDVVFIESAWRGVNDSWRGLLVDSEAGRFSPVVLLSKLCRTLKIKVVFWNKEDPVHHDRFSYLATLGDICLTTNIGSVKKYQQLLGKVRKPIDVQPFFFQPVLHYADKTERDDNQSDKVIFCGGLYRNEFPDRYRRLKQAVDALANMTGLIVYDRFDDCCSSWTGIEGVEVRPTFDYTESKCYYQKGAAQLNVNSVDGLSTMFSRRLLELLACNAKVIDLTAHKDKGLLSQFVLQASTETEIRQSLEKEKPVIDHSFLVENYSVRSVLNRIQNLL